MHLDLRSLFKIIPDYFPRASQAVLVVKSPVANAVDTRGEGSILGWGRSPGAGNSNPLQYSCLENPTDRGAWWATDHGVPKSRTRLNTQHTHYVPSPPPSPICNIKQTLKTTAEKQTKKQPNLFK